MSVQMCMDSFSVSRGLSALYVNQELTDVRLVCTDGQLLAHKTVLAAVSNKFLQILTEDNTMHSNAALIVFSNTSIEDIKSIIDCIYFGRQNIESNRFNKLRQIADNFGIKLTTAVSAAFAPTNVSHPFISSVCPDPMPAHQNNYEKPEPSADQPMDLSVFQEEVDNVQKIIDSIAANGPKTPCIRRRKQSYPKSIPKVVRFGETKESLVSDPNHQSNPLAEDMTEFNHFNNIGDLSVTQSASDPPIQATLPIKNEVKSENKSEIKNVFNNLQNSFLKVKAFQKFKISPKSESISEEQLKDCCVCGKSHSTHKQLILHLNKEHKTSEGFKCAVCGKEQKYAKTFAVHSIQCQTNKG